MHWGPAAIRTGSLRRTATRALLVGRYCFAAIFAFGAAAKLAEGWLRTDALQQHFVKRLEAFDLTPIQAGYLEHFAIPCYQPIAWVVTLGELGVAIGLIFGVATRASGALALFLLINFAAGGYYNSLSLPLFLFAALILLLPWRPRLSWHS